jgi:hypothetical protein
VTNRKCWLKHLFGDTIPSLNENGSRCGFIPGRVIDVIALKATVTNLTATVSQLQSQINGKL